MPILDDFYYFIGFGITAIILIVLLLELLVRFLEKIKTVFIGKQLRRQDFLHKDYHVYIDWTDNWDKPIFKYIPVGLRYFNNKNCIPPVLINKQGMRAIELDEIRSDAYKVILIGGSAAWGFGASSNSTTIAGYLEEFLSEKYHLDSRYHGVQVINLAQVNQTITQDLIELVHYLPIIKPNLVVGMNGWNELIANMVSDDEIINTHGRFPLNELVDWAPMSATSQTSKDFIKATRLMLRSKSLFAKSLIKDHGVKLKRSPKEAIKLGTPILLSGINNAYKLVQSYGADYMVFLQPNIYSKKYLTKSEAQSVTLYDDIRPMLGGKKTGDFLRSNNIYNGIIKSLESDIKLSVYDLSTIFSHDKEHMHYSVVHCTDKGYKKIAKTIFEKISNVS